MPPADSPGKRVLPETQSGSPTQREVSKELFQQMVQLRRDLHRCPELSGEETLTAQRVSRELRALGVPHDCGVAGHGIVADLPGQALGPRIALRADLDALPITEETGLSFSSTRPGVMHACGHDGHATLLVGAAALLKGEPPPRPVRLIWQPAEETATGAKAMVGEGVLEGVAAIFGGHVDRHYAPGSLVVTDGPVNAATDLFFIDIRGQQGHGARPHEALDATVAGSLLVTALQTIVSREVDPAHPSVVTVGQFQSGEAPNVISGRARLSGTIRSQSDEVRQHLRSAIRRIAESIGMLHGAAVDVDIRPGTPPVVNKGACVTLARQAAIEVVGESCVTVLRTPNMGGEDFSFFLEKVPGAYVRFGSGVVGREGFPAHSSGFDFDERALATGAAFFAHAARLAGEHVARGLAFT